MLKSIAIRAAGMMAGLTAPDKIGSIFKFMYIKSLLDYYQVELILDVGANVGQFAKSMRMVGYMGQIISFEPVSSAFATLAGSARGDEKWRTCNFALGDTATTQVINVMKSSTFSSFNEPSAAETAEFAHSNTVLRQETVEIKRLTDVATEFGIEPMLGRTLLKCDTQGFDLNVLRGAGDLLSRVRMLQIELSVTKIYDGAPGMNEMLPFLEARGFAPVSFFPVSKMPDWSAAEFDYLGVNRTLDLH